MPEPSISSIRSRGDRKFRNMERNDRIRILLGTRKGTYVVEGDRKRRTWKVGPAAHEGSEVYHVVADPRHPGDLYAAVNNAFWGPQVQRSRNWGKTWQEIATPLTPRRKDRQPLVNDKDPTTPAPATSHPPRPPTPTPPTPPPPRPPPRPPRAQRLGNPRYAGSCFWFF